VGGSWKKFFAKIVFYGTAFQVGYMMMLCQMGWPATLTGENRDAINDAIPAFRLMFFIILQAE